MIALFERRGFWSGEDRLATTSPVLAGLLSASTRGLLSGGRRLRRVLSDPREGVRTGHLCCAASGFSLHAATSIEAYDRKRLEELCRYAQRPPLAMGSLEMLSSDLLSFRMKAPWDDGTTQILLSPMDLIERLAALVPPPRAHLVRYHGILAPNAKDRAKVVPTRESGADPSEDGKNQAGAKAPPRRASARLLWAALLARIFNVQGEKCPRCGRKMKLVAALTDPASVRKYLEGVGLPAEPPAISPARPPP